MRKLLHKLFMYLTTHSKVSYQIIILRQKIDNLTTKVVNCKIIQRIKVIKIMTHKMSK